MTPGAPERAVAIVATAREVASAGLPPAPAVKSEMLEGEPITIVDLGTDDGADIEFGPERLGMTARSAQL